jgi:antitoxin VapB
VSSRGTADRCHADGSRYLEHEVDFFLIALSIKNDEADRVARELAATTGESLTDAVLVALRERLERERARRQGTVGQRLRRLVAEVATMPVVDARHPDEILGYDDDGMPA